MESGIIINKDIEINHFEQWSPDFLCEYLTNTHHVYIRKKIRELIAECRLEAGNPAAKLLSEKLKEMKSDFDIHMNKEEKFIFPYIKNLVRLLEENKSFEVPPFGGLEAPATVLKKEHCNAGNKLKSLMSYLSSSSDNSLKTFIRQLEDFERNLIYHMEIENNLLFPKAISLEKKLKNKSKTKNKNCIMKKQNVIKVFLAAALIAGFITYGCSDDPELGIGPVKEVKLDPQVNNDLVNKGKQIFDIKCTPCHRVNEKLVGPALKDVTKRRKPEWIMNMILNPTQMVAENMIAKSLATSGQYPTPMTFQNVTQDDARAILEYFRSNDQ